MLWRLIGSFLSFEKGRPELPSYRFHQGLPR